MKDLENWVTSDKKNFESGLLLAKKYLRDKHLVERIEKKGEKMIEKLIYKLERRFYDLNTKAVDKADAEYIKKLTKKQAKPAKTNQSSSKEQAEEKQPVKQNADGLSFEKGLPEELTPEVVEELKKRAGKLRHEAAIAHADMKKAKTDKERFELAAVVVARDAESRAIWNRLENKGKVEKMPDRELSDTEKLAKILSGGGIKTIKDSLKRAKKKLREAETDKAKKLAQRSVDKYTEQVAEFNRLMGADNGRQES